jgi:hypothetical protein
MLLGERNVIMAVHHASYTISWILLEHGDKLRMASILLFMFPNVHFIGGMLLKGMLWDMENDSGGKWNIMEAAVSIVTMKSI